MAWDPGHLGFALNAKIGRLASSISRSRNVGFTYPTSILNRQLAHLEYWRRHEAVGIETIRRSSWPYGPAASLLAVSLDRGVVMSGWRPFGSVIVTA
jgi:hypothetical protein